MNEKEIRARLEEIHYMCMESKVTQMNDELSMEYEQLIDKLNKLPVKDVKKENDYPF